MRPNPGGFLEKCRVTWGRLATDSSNGNNGVFIIPTDHGPNMNVVASDGMGWEHVSVDAGKRCPTWEEMCFVKDLFWAPDEMVIQYHPREAEYVDLHPTTLHMWKPVGVDLPAPPTILVGPGSRKRNRHARREGVTP